MRRMQLFVDMGTPLSEEIDYIAYPKAPNEWQMLSQPDTPYIEQVKDVLPRLPSLIVRMTDQQYPCYYREGIWYLYQVGEDGED